MSGNSRELLYKQFRSRAESNGQQRVMFPVYWHGRVDRKLEAIFLESTLRVVVTNEIIQELNSVPESYYSTLKEGSKHRAYSKACAEQLREKLGKSVSLNVYATAVRVAIDMSNRTTPNVNVYRHFQVKPQELLPYITEQQLASLESQGKLKNKALRFSDLCTTLFPTEQEPVKAEISPDDTSVELSSLEGPTESVWEHNRNVIFFGPPGTGKSFKVQEIVSGFLGTTEENVIRVTFHPEFSYFDLVGSFRPVVGWLKSVGTFRDADGINRDLEPRTYYRFEPGPLSRAIRLAATKASESVVLIIEEINRGNCAGIFGDVFQLLDRIRSSKNPSLVGWSEYGIQPNSEWCGWLEREIPEASQVYDKTRRFLRLPGNLYLYATMNTSDQSLFPMDTAFRRRWGMSYVGISDYDDQSAKVRLHVNDEEGVAWTDLMHELNKEIVNYTRTDDKQMGPWFVRKRSGSDFVDVVEFKSKVLFYLWADVFRDQTSLVFDQSLNTYEEVLARYNAGKRVFSKTIVNTLKKKDVEEAVSEEPDSSLGKIHNVEGG